MSISNKYIKKLRDSGLRPTRQRIKICEVLFEPHKTFHFSVNDLTKKIQNQSDEKISVATVYNTVHAFEKKGYLKQIPINSNQTYFDTNISDHHHFYDTENEELIDLDNKDIGPINIQKTIPGKKIKSVEVLVKLED
tara:strand:- start:1471 stop:1881 length:411 start_codon:yes stop_codon:yes gene_type:complete